MTASDPWFKATLTNEGPDLELGEVSLSGAVDSEGANILVAAPVIARSEAIERSFVVEITLENNGEETVVVRRSTRDSGQTNRSSCAAVSTFQRAIGPSA